MLNITTTGKVQKINDPSRLIRFLDHRSASIRGAALSRLYRFDKLDNSMVSRMKQMINDKSPVVRNEATLRFAAMGDYSVNSNFLDIIINGSLSEKIELLRIIESRGPGSDEISLQTVMHGLLDRKEAIKFRALEAAEAMKNSHLIPYVAECLNEKHHNLRIRAARVLFIIGGENSSDYLIGLLADKNAEVSSAARVYLTKMNYEPARKAVHGARFNKLIETMNGLEPERKTAAAKIGEENIREGLPLLYIGCKDKYREVRIESLKSIAVFKNPASVEVVGKLLNDRSFAVRLEAIKTLESIGDQRSIIALEWAAANDRRKNIRTAALSAIVKLKSR